MEEIMKVFKEISNQYFMTDKEDEERKVLLRAYNILKIRLDETK